ncbi:MAG TPA: ATP-binding protein [Gaiellaceae bacterium]|nr:ATP-binding protein [Gaiellaceae bacterium]
MRRAKPAVIPSRAGAERPPRLAFRFAAYTGVVLLVVGVAMLWVLQRDVTSRAERRVERQTQQVAEATLRAHLRRADFASPVPPARRRELDAVFENNTYLGGILEATLYSPTGRVTYSTEHSLIGTRRQTSELASALRGNRERSVQTMEGPGDGLKILRTVVPVRPQGAPGAIGALSLSQDYRALDVQINEAIRHTAVIFVLALLGLWASLIPILRRTTRQLHARNDQLREQAADLERALAERREAQESVHQLAAIVEASDDAITRTERDGTVVTWNPGAERLFGYSAREIVGRPLAILVPQNRMHELGSVAKRINEGEGVEDHETRGLRKDGTEVDVSLTVSPILDEAGIVTGAAVIARDVTHLKRQQWQLEALLAKERVARAEAEDAQRALHEQNERLRELDRLKDEFISLVSHELRTPLTSIHGYLELLLDGGAGDLSAEQERFLTVVERNSKRLMQLVGDLLFMAQVEAGKLALDLDEVDLGEIVGECLEAAKPIADDRRIELVADIAETPSMLGDRSRLGQVLDNLISNALKFTPSSGRVSVRMSLDDGDAVVEVADTGVGIPSAEQDRLFERFFRSSTATEQAIPGTGLGLTIAKTIVERHEGSISIESAEGDGTTVRVRLPVRARRGINAEVAA